MESLGRCPDSKPTPTLCGWVHVPSGNRQTESVAEYKTSPDSLGLAVSSVDSGMRGSRRCPSSRDAPAHSTRRDPETPGRPAPTPAPHFPLSSTPSAQPCSHTVLWRRPWGSAGLALGPCRGWRVGTGSECPPGFGVPVGSRKNVSLACGGAVRVKAWFSKSGQRRWSSPLRSAGAAGSAQVQTGLSGCSGLWQGWAPVPSQGTGQWAAQGGAAPVMAQNVALASVAW